MYHVYFIKSLKNNKVYVGSTSKQPETRLKEHNSNSNTFTKHNKPFKLIYYETYICKRDSLNRERFYKTGFGKKIKKAIIQAIES